MDPIRLKLIAATLGAAAVVATAVAIGGAGRQAPAAGEAGDPALVDRVVAALDAPAPGTLDIPAQQPPAPGVEETAAAIAAATRLALAEIVPAAPAAVPIAPRPTPAPTGTFQAPPPAEAPAFVISAADAFIAADQGWIAASGLAPVTIEPRPRPRAR